MGRKYISLWLDSEILKESDAVIKNGSARNRSEYFEEALKFYNSYLSGKNYEEFMSKTLMKIFQSTMDGFERRMARQMFKQAVEVTKVFWLVVRGFNLNPEDVNDLHTDCVAEVKTIDGAIRFPYKNRDDDA